MMIAKLTKPTRRPPHPPTPSPARGERESSRVDAIRSLSPGGRGRKIFGHNGAKAGEGFFPRFRENDPLIFSSGISRKALRFGCVALAMLFAGTVALAAPIRVKDERGKVISLPAPPARIVSVAPSNTEILFALGLDKRIVGVTDYCDYPPAALKKPKVGGMILNVERIVALKPDLVFAKYDLQKSGIERLEKLGLRVYAVDPRTVTDSLATVEGVGRATGTEARAKLVAAGMRRALSQAKIVAARDGAHPRVLNVIQSKPLIVAGPKTFLDDALHIAGAVNLAGDAKEPYAPFSLESAVARKPDVLLLSSGVAPQSIYADPAWRTTPAVRNRRVFAPALMHVLERPGPRLANAVLRLAELLHPK